MNGDKIYTSSFYGDSTRWFIGTVEDNVDPMKLGRVRVRIRGLHSDSQIDIQTSDLPWAQVAVPTTEGGTSGIGRNPGLLPGAEVFGYFLDGKSSQLPLVLGSIPKIESPSDVQRAFNSKNQRVNASYKSGNVGPGTGVTGERNITSPTSPVSYGAAGSSNAEKAFNFFTVNGFTPQQAAGIVGNLMQESGPELNTSIKAAGSEQSFGIAQWNKAAKRYQLLEEFAKDVGKPWTDLDVQLRFILWELENFSYLGLAQVRSAQTIEEATIAFEEKYERPSAPHRSSRINYAKDIYARMKS